MQRAGSDSGIQVVGEIPFGTHFCQFYRTRQDLIDTLVPFFMAGLRNNELCLWVTSEPLRAAEAKAAMAALDGSDLQGRQHHGRGAVVARDARRRADRGRLSEGHQLRQGCRQADRRLLPERGARRDP